MSRWTPDARGRLEQAALDLYRERGFEHTTVADIAARAGLTERTFFRHFADKREVLFGGATALQDRLVEAVLQAPEECSPIEAVAHALAAIKFFTPERRQYSRQRQHVLAANAELQERELMKLAALAAALAGALRRRGVADPAATLAADAGVAVFKVAFGRWIDGPALAFPPLVRSALDDLRTVFAGP